MTICKICGKQEASNSILKDMCLNCYNNMKDQNRSSDIEAEHDYYEGYGII